MSLHSRNLHKWTLFSPLFFQLPPCFRCQGETWDMLSEKINRYAKCFIRRMIMIKKPRWLIKAAASSHETDHNMLHFFVCECFVNEIIWCKSVLALIEHLHRRNHSIVPRTICQKYPLLSTSLNHWSYSVVTVVRHWFSSYKAATIESDVIVCWLAKYVP